MERLSLRKSASSTNTMLHEEFCLLYSPLEVNRRYTVMQAFLAACFVRDSCLAYSSTLKMETTSYSETSVDFQWTTRHHVPGDSIVLHEAMSFLLFRRPISLRTHWRFEQLCIDRSV
jgi:hypothetical protein